VSRIVRKPNATLGFVLALVALALASLALAVLFS
jgi:hypothetical protein